jgi:hypothetical protein
MADNLKVEGWARNLKEELGKNRFNIHLTKQDRD